MLSVLLCVFNNHLVLSQYRSPDILTLPIQAQKYGLKLKVVLKQSYTYIMYIESIRAVSLRAMSWNMEGTDKWKGLT